MSFELPHTAVHPLSCGPHACFCVSLTWFFIFPFSFYFIVWELGVFAQVGFITGKGFPFIRRICHTVTRLQPTIGSAPLENGGIRAIDGDRPLHRRAQWAVTSYDLSVQEGTGPYTGGPK